MNETLNEKRNILDKYTESVKVITPMLRQYVNSEDQEGINEIHKQFIDAFLPVLQMYTDAVNNAICPCNILSVPVAIAALEIVAESLRKDCEIPDAVIQIRNFTIFP